MIPFRDLGNNAHVSLDPDGTFKLTCTYGLGGTGHVFLRPESMAALIDFAQAVEIRNIPLFYDAVENTFPLIKSSGPFLPILEDGDPPPKFCLELGAAIMFDKPILALVLPGVKIPTNLTRVASVILQGHPSDPDFQGRFQKAMTALIENDARLKPEESQKP